MRTLAWFTLLLGLALWIGGAAILSWPSNPSAVAGVDVAVALAAAVVLVVVVNGSRRRPLPLLRRLALTRLPFVGLAAALTSRLVIGPRLAPLRATAGVSWELARLEAISRGLALASLGAAILSLLALAAHLAERSGSDPESWAP